MELWYIAILALIINGFTVYWGGKWLAWIGVIPSFTLRSLIRNNGYAYWDDQQLTNKEQNK